MQDPLSKADHYRKEAVKYHELAKTASPAFFGDFYRRVAVRYLFMAEEMSRPTTRRSDVASSRSG